MRSSDEETRAGGSLVGVWHGGSCGTSVFQALTLHKIRRQKFGKNPCFHGKSGIFLTNSASEKHLVDCGKWAFHTSPSHNPLEVLAEQ